MWINPANPNHIIDGNDGGVGISYDKGKTWEGIYNMDLGQFYHVTYDMETPYNVCGGLQDNYTWCGPSAVRSRNGIVNDDWFSDSGRRRLRGADRSQRSAHHLRRVAGRQHRRASIACTNERKTIRPLPARGEAPLPLELEHADPDLAARLDDDLRRRQQGLQVHRPRPDSWTAISRDLTQKHRSRNAVADGRQAARRSRSPRTTACSRTATSCSSSSRRSRPGVLYAGTDDGNVHMTQDGGKTWTNITAEVPERAEERATCRGLVAVGARRQRRLCDASTTIAHDDYEQLRLRERRRRQQLPLDRRGHSRRATPSRR